MRREGEAALGQGEDTVGMPGRDGNALYGLRSGLRAGNLLLLAGEVSIWPAVPSRFFFLPMTVHQGLPVCLLGGRQTSALNPPGTRSLSLPRNEWGMGYTLDLRPPSGRCPALWPSASGRTYKMGMGPSF